jgi:hypothetical protein
MVPVQRCRNRDYDGPQAVKGSACPARAAQILKVFDLTLPCALCEYAIPPNELLHVGWHDVMCPACGGVCDSRAGRSCKPQKHVLKKVHDDSRRQPGDDGLL